MGILDSTALFRYDINLLKSVTGVSVGVDILISHVKFTFHNFPWSTLSCRWVVFTGFVCRGELSGLDQFLDRTSAVYSILLYTVVSSIDYVIHQWHFG